MIFYFLIQKNTNVFQGVFLFIFKDFLLANGKLLLWVFWRKFKRLVFNFIEILFHYSLIIKLNQILEDPNRIKRKHPWDNILTEITYFNREWKKCLKRIVKISWISKSLQKNSESRQPEGEYSTPKIEQTWYSKSSFFSPYKFEP